MVAKRWAEPTLQCLTPTQPEFCTEFAVFDGCVGNTVKHTAVDGKQRHRSCNTHNNKSAIHQVSTETQPVPLFLDTIRSMCYNKSSSVAVSGTPYTDLIEYTVLFLF